MPVLISSPLSLVVVDHTALSITTSHKAASGFLYPLERGLIFIHKPPIFLRYDELRSVSFERSGGSTRSFEINAVTRNEP